MGGGSEKRGDRRDATKGGHVRPKADTPKFKSCPSVLGIFPFIWCVMWFMCFVREFRDDAYNILIKI